MPEAATLDESDRAIINALQGGFPICEAPFGVVAQKLAMSEAELLTRVERLLADQVLTRFGPMYQVERMGGAFVLAALAVPEERFEEVAEKVNALPQVAHNYRREHTLNMWFVLATESPQGISEAIGRIEADTGLVVHAFPKIREYFVDMRLVA